MLVHVTISEAMVSTLLTLAEHSLSVYLYEVPVDILLDRSTITLVKNWAYEQLVIGHPSEWEDIKQDGSPRFLLFSKSGMVSLPPWSCWLENGTILYY